jgi:hypothetical protein
MLLSVKLRATSAFIARIIRGRVCGAASKPDMSRFGRGQSTRRPAGRDWRGKLMDIFDLNRKRWAVILAGGEGRRLSFYTRQLSGRAIPKQFCRVIGRTSLLQQTMERVSLIVDSQHPLTALTRSHEQYLYADSYAPSATATGRSAHQSGHRASHYLFVAAIEHPLAPGHRGLDSLGPLRER